MYLSVLTALAEFSCRGCLAIALACRAICKFKAASRPLTEIIAPCTWLKNMVTMYGLARDKFKASFGGDAWEEAWQSSKECQNVLSKMSKPERVKRRPDHLYKAK